jgi:hypothetical protein
MQAAQFHLTEWSIRFAPAKALLDEFAFVVTDGTAFVVALSAGQAVPVPIAPDVFVNVRGHLALAQAVNKSWVLIPGSGVKTTILEVERPEFVDAT